MAKKSLNDKLLAKLNKPKNKDYDIENEEWEAVPRDDEQLRNNDESEDDDDNEDEEKAKRGHYVNVEKSRIRDDAMDVGRKYTGSKVGRKDIYENESNSENESESEIEDEDEDEGEQSGDDILADVTDSEGSEVEDQSENEDEAENDASELEDEANDGTGFNSDEDEEELYKRKKVTKLLANEKKQILSRLSTSAKSDALKGYTILEQGSEYDKILDARIKIQKAIHAGNSLPIKYKYYKQNKTNDTEIIESSVEEKLYDLIDKLVNVRNEQLVKDGLVKSKLEINHKKRSLDEMIESNQKINDVFKPVCKSVLTKWSNRVQSASGVGALNQGKFKVVNQSVWSQVNNQLDDLDRLVKKTKINRRGVNPIGYDEELKADKQVDNDTESDEDEDDEIAAGLSNIDKSLQTNEYVFDDDDFYRLLLNDLINKKLDQKQANNSAAILMLSRNKMQKNYDRMATKGRKLKYTVQEPLAQFEIPKRKQYSWNDEQIDELFAGLFGMKFDLDDDENESETNEETSEDVSALKQSAVKMFG